MDEPLVDDQAMNLTALANSPVVERAIVREAMKIRFRKSHLAAIVERLAADLGVEPSDRDITRTRFYDDSSFGQYYDISEIFYFETSRTNYVVSADKVNGGNGALEFTKLYRKRATQFLVNLSVDGTLNNTYLHSADVSLSLKNPSKDKLDEFLDSLNMNTLDLDKLEEEKTFRRELPIYVQAARQFRV